MGVNKNKSQTKIYNAGDRGLILNTNKNEKIYDFIGRGSCKCLCKGSGERKW